MIAPNAAFSELDDIIDLADDEDIVDLFAGLGGATTGIEEALGRRVNIAVNHSLAAIAMHQANHPNTRHFCENVFDVDPRAVMAGRRVGLLWASPDCRHFSRAKGAQPVSKKIRGLAWVVVSWAAAVAPRVIFLENVPEFEEWGPVVQARDRRGRLIYDQHGQAVMVPDRAHMGETFKEFVAQLEALGYHVEWRLLKACDYGTPTIRERLFLIARRDEKAIVWPDATHGPDRLHSYLQAHECIDWSDLGRSIFTRSHPLAEKSMVRIAKGVYRYVLQDPDPFVIRTSGGLIAPHITKYYSGVVGLRATDPLGTITAIDHHGLVCAMLTKYSGEELPRGSRQRNGCSRKLRAFLIKYYGAAMHGQSLREPLHTVTSKSRFGLVTVAGEDYQISDIFLRMLRPRELARGQGFDDSTILLGTVEEQIGRIGNSVCPPLARAVVRANFLPGLRAA